MYTEEGRELLKKLLKGQLPNKNLLEFYFQGIYDGTVKTNPDGSIKPSGGEKPPEWILNALPTAIYWAFSPWGGTINYDFYNKYIKKLEEHEVYRFDVLSTFLKKLKEFTKEAEKKTEKFRKTVSKIQAMFRKKRACVET